MLNPVPATALPTLEEWMDDFQAVLDDIGSEKAAIVTAMAGGFMACVFAATYPDRARALIIIDGFARLTRADDYPWGLTATQARARRRGVRVDMGHGDDARPVRSRRRRRRRAPRVMGGAMSVIPSARGTAASMVDTTNATDTAGSCRPSGS